nr:hypothetical protein [Tanacetum cinerariifolium]
MYETVPPIPPPLGTTTGNPSAGSPNRVDNIHTDNTNNTTTNNDSDSDVEEDLRSSCEFIADLNAEYHERALHANQKRFYKRSGRVGPDYKVKYKGLKAELDVLTKKINDISKAKSEKGFVAKSFDWDKKSVSSGRGNKNDTISSKEVFFSKVVESSSETAPEITSDSESDCDFQKPLPPFLKLLGAEPNYEIYLADLTLNRTISGEIKKVPDKRLAVNVLKKKAPPTTSTVPDLSLVKKADSSTEKLLLTLMEEVKGSSSRKAHMLPKTLKDCKYCGFNDHHSDEYEYYPEYDICGSIMICGL